jgi:hypothetical protein
MNNDLSSNEIRRFYQELQENLVDNRSNIGRKHELAFVITLLIVSILLSYDHLSLSKIHRDMKRHYAHLCIFLHKHPKGSSFEHLNQKDMEKIQNELNNRPSKRYQYLSRSIIL